jgi:hypothetical protein
MRFYEVGETIRPGLLVKLGEGHKPSITLVEHDDEYGTPACLALGSTICRELKHPDDQDKRFILQWGQLKSTTAGEMLVAQTKEEAYADNLALVVITRGYLPRIGITKVESADRFDRPEHLTYAKGDGIRKELFVMRPHTALFIKWDKRLLGADQHLKFILAWDWVLDAGTGESSLELRQLPVASKAFVPRPKSLQPPIQELRS